MSKKATNTRNNKISWQKIIAILSEFSRCIVCSIPAEKSSFHLKPHNNQIHEQNSFFNASNEDLLLKCAHWGGGGVYTPIPGISSSPDIACNWNGWEEGGLGAFCYFKSLIHIPQGWNLPKLYLTKEHKKIYINHVRQTLSSVDISIFPRRLTIFVASRNACKNCILLHNLFFLTIIELIKVVLINVITSLIMSAKLATPGLPKSLQQNFISCHKLYCKSDNVKKVW